MKGRKENEKWNTFYKEKSGEQQLETRAFLNKKEIFSCLLAKINYFPTKQN